MREGRNPWRKHQGAMIRDKGKSNNYVKFSFILFSYSSSFILMEQLPLAFVVAVAALD